MVTKNKTNILPELIEGVKEIENIVKVTMGARGRMVIIQNLGGAGKPTVTDDGVTVAKEMKFDNTPKGMGARIIRDTAEYALEKEGDGTTGAIVLAAALAKIGAKRLSTNPNISREIIAGFKKAQQWAIEYLENKTIKVKGEKDLAKIAKISTNSNDLGKIISKAVNTVGANGKIKVNKKPREEKSYKFKMSPGYYLEMGYKPMGVPPEWSSQKIHLGKTVVAFWTKTLHGLDREMEYVLNFAKGEGLSVVLVALNFSDVLAANIPQTAANNNMVIIPVVAGAAIEDMREQFGDLIAIAGSGTLINEDVGGMDETALSIFDEVIIDDSSTTFVKENPDEEWVEERLKTIKENMGSNSFQRKYNELRIAKLKNGVGSLTVAAPTEGELRKTLDLIDDGIKACQSAMRGGYVIGGGKVFMNIRKYISEKLGNTTDVGVEVFLEALLAPISTIVENSGKSPEYVIETLEKKSENFGFDAVTMEVTNILKKGIIDPTSVIKAIINAAVSASSSILGSVAAVYTDDKNIEPDPLQYTSSRKPVYE